MQIYNTKQHCRDKKHKQVDFPPIPDKLYFTIGEAGDLCLVAPYVIRFWEHEFLQLKPAKRRCNRRYYQKEQVLLIRKIRNLLYQEGFTIEGARARLAMSPDVGADAQANVERATNGFSGIEKTVEEKIIQVKDKTFLKEVAGNLEEILSVLEADDEGQKVEG